MEHHEWRRRYSHMRDIADRVVAMRIARIRRLASDAGLDGSIFAIHINNAMVAAEMGRPWVGVDYSLVRQAARLERALYEPYRIVSRWDKRVRGF